MWNLLSRIPGLKRELQELELEVVWLEEQEKEQEKEHQMLLVRIKLLRQRESQGLLTPKESQKLQQLRKLLRQQESQILQERQLQELKKIQDSWVRRLRLEEKIRLSKTSYIFAIAIISVLLISGFIVAYFNVSAAFVQQVAIGIGGASIFWLLVGYGDHELRKIRVQHEWYGNNAMEVYELMKFIEKTTKDDDSNSGNPRRFFTDDSLGRQKNDASKEPLPNGIKVS